jgi:nicotinate-nucleotide adenylyltransferase
MPVSIPVHKDSSAIIDGTHRLEMTKLAASAIPNAVVSDIEIKKGGNSYTIDTVREILKSCNNADIAVIIGDDLLDGLYKWKEIDNLCRLAHFVCLTRESVRPPLPYPIEYVDNPIVEVSSSQIRERIKNGERIDNLVPISVAQYIAAHHLYE